MIKAMRRLLSLGLVGLLLLSGCAKEVDKPIEDIAIGEPNPSAEAPVDPATETSMKIDDETAKAMELERTIDGIRSIVLKDLDGNLVDRSFSEEEVKGIQEAFNDSFIMDTAYIAMIAGYSMTISLEDGREVFITSYGDEVFIVARIGDGPSYHLGCEVIASILMEGSK